MSIKIKVCLGCHASYNDGFLFDKWFTVESVDDLQDAQKEFRKHVDTLIQKEKPDWFKGPTAYDIETYSEELYAADWEVYIDDEFLKHDFNECLWDMEKFLEKFENVSFNNDLELLIAVMENNGQELDDLEEIDRDLCYYELENDSNYELGYTIATETCLLDEMPEHLQSYFDFESYGRDCQHEFNIFTTSKGTFAVHAA